MAQVGGVSVGVAPYRMTISGMTRVRNMKHTLDDGWYRSRKVIEGYMVDKLEIVPTSGLIAEWLFNDNLLDTSGSGYTLTDKNGCAFISGYNGTNCVKFQTPNVYAYRYVYTDNILSNVFNNRHPWTITCLIKITPDMTFPITIKFANTGGLGQFYEPSAAEVVINKTSASGCYGQGQLNAYDYATPTYEDITLNTYAFVSYKFDGTNICLRVNYNSAVTPTSRSGCIAYHLYINGQAMGNIFALENLRVWDRALTVEEEDGLCIVGMKGRRVNL